MMGARTVKNSFLPSSEAASRVSKCLKGMKMVQVKEPPGLGRAIILPRRVQVECLTVEGGATEIGRV